ncbi:hypothetical protein ATKI12_8782 [Kitasatospora sp. Ki12]
MTSSGTPPSWSSSGSRSRPQASAAAAYSARCRLPPLLVPSPQLRVRARRHLALGGPGLVLVQGKRVRRHDE